MYFNASFFYFLPFYARFRDFFSVFRVVCCISLSLLRVSNPHMPTVGSGALLAILTDCQQPNTQKYSDDACRPSRNRTWYHAFRGGRCAARYPHGPPAAKNKNT